MQAAAMQPHHHAPLPGIFWWPGCTWHLHRNGGINTSKSVAVSGAPGRPGGGWAPIMHVQHSCRPAGVCGPLRRCALAWLKVGAANRHAAWHNAVPGRLGGVEREPHARHLWKPALQLGPLADAVFQCRHQLCACAAREGGIHRGAWLICSITGHHVCVRPPEGAAITCLHRGPCRCACAYENSTSCRHLAPPVTWILTVSSSIGRMLLRSRCVSSPAGWMRSEHQRNARKGHDAKQLQGPASVCTQMCDDGSVVLPHAPDRSVPPLSSATSLLQACAAAGPPGKTLEGAFCKGADANTSLKMANTAQHL